ncbi:CHASE domain-containing protein [Cryptosporangium phraense]|uniref:CHASE domain-containing protein n=1 Tax=Cryptosporangium phraense TaxID=2593070 RepID=A0A545AVF5_9ACTN|nr:CHASE domain-containing protein [Cryptosporangium phraense]TQS45303.1 hypothetical protein FL583_09395 [Cryptosporangium phraense]
MLGWAALAMVVAVLVTGGLVTVAAFGLVDRGEDRYAVQVMDRYADELTAGLDTTRLPGAAAVDFVVPATTAQIPGMQRAWRAEGTPGLTRRPAAGASSHAFVIFEHTFDRPAGIAGLDLAPSVAADQALRAARQNGGLTISPAFLLLRDEHLALPRRQQSVVFTVAVYSGIGSGEPDVFRGWIVMPVRGQNFLSRILLDRGQGAVRAQVSEDAPRGSPTELSSRRPRPGAGSPRPR